MNRRTFIEKSLVVARIMAGARRALCRAKKQRESRAFRATPRLPRFQSRRTVVDITGVRQVALSSRIPDEVRTAIRRLKPREFLRQAADLSNIIHALRLWGPSHRTTESGELCGEQLLSCLLDNNVYKQLVSNENDLLIESEHGVHVWNYPDPKAEPHTDKILSVCGENRIPLDLEVVTRTGRADVFAVLCDSLMRFDIGQQELAWSAIAYGCTCDPAIRGQISLELRYNSTT